MSKSLFRRLSAILLSALTLWACIVISDSRTLSDAAQAVSQSSEITKTILRWELGDLWSGTSLSPVSLLALSQSPLLMAQRSAIAQRLEEEVGTQDATQPSPQPQPTDSPSSQQQSPSSAEDGYDWLCEGLQFLDNGAPSQTVRVSSSKGYTVVNGVYIKNSSSRKLNVEALSKTDFSTRLADQGPQVLIVHSHGSEAYTMPKGQSYKSSGTFRTADTSCNVVRIGDEIAAVLSAYGISVLHDRTLHDVPSYNDAYISSQASIEQYLKKYPTISFVLDVHRDAIQDGNGKYYKLVSREDPRAAQCSIVLGLEHERWQENLKLAIAVQENINAASPTLMRPMVARAYRYNQHLCPGSLLVEVGAAGNSLDEAILGGRLFARSFAETILHP